MTIYPMMFADHQFTSYQSQKADGSGAKVWFAATTTPGNPAPPRTILLLPDGLAVVYQDRLERRSPDGKVSWTQEHEGGLGAFVAEGRFYFRNQDYGLAAVDASGNLVIDDFFLPNSTDMGWLMTVVPRQDGKFLVQAMNRAMEETAMDSDATDEYSLILMGQDAYDDWVYFLHYEGECLPGAVTRDGKQIVVANSRGKVVVFDVDDGTPQESFELEETEICQMSLDREENLVLTTFDIQGKGKLASYTRQGDLVWEIPLAHEPTGDFQQPPAIDGDNRVLYAVGGELLVVDQGKLVWKKMIPTAPLTYLTVLGDNSVLVATGGVLSHFDGDGNELFTRLLDPAGIITTPPVVDDVGRVYVGTVEGIHCLK